MLTVTAIDTAGALHYGPHHLYHTPAAADHLFFLQQPTETAAGQRITPAVMVAVVD
jgi:hypothetical protein